MTKAYSCYLFTEIPASKRWVLAVFATSKHDAYNYMKSMHKGGKCIGEVKSGKVQADCGAVTPNAQHIISGINQ